MLKKLRAKFIALNMATVVVVLVVAFSAICYIDYRQSMQDVNAALEAAIATADEVRQEAEGPDIGYPGSEESPLLGGQEGDADEGEAQDESTAVDLASGGEESQDGADDESAAGEESAAGDDEEDEEDLSGVPPEIGGNRDWSEQIIPVAVFILEEDGSLEAASGQNTASIADDVLEEAAAELADVADGDGTLSGLGLHYMKSTVGDVTYLAFADVSATSGWRQLALTLSLIGVVVFVAFFVISLFFSRWALKPVDEAWQQQRQFVADASHDLKTPLTVILANTSIVLEHPERSVASQSQWIESTQHEAESMQELVGDLLTLAKIDEGATQHELEELDFSELVEGETLQFESVAFERRIELESSIDEGIRLSGNPAHLRRLVSSLLDNACKYAENGGRVDVKLERDGRTAVYAVHNTGPAIPAEDLPHVFDRFYRGDKARGHDENSFGLGLSIAYGIAQEHGGELAVVSNEAEGTTFTATLPLPED